MTKHCFLETMGMGPLPILGIVLVIGLGAIVLAAMYPIAITTFVAHLLFGSEGGKLVTHSAIEKRCARVRNALYGYISLMGVSLLVVGFIVRSTWFFLHRTGIVAANVGENLAFAGFVFSVILVPAGLLLYTGLVHGYDTALRLRRNQIVIASLSKPLSERDSRLWDEVKELWRLNLDRTQSGFWPSLWRSWRVCWWNWLELFVKALPPLLIAGIVAAVVVFFVESGCPNAAMGNGPVLFQIVSMVAAGGLVIAGGLAGSLILLAMPEHGDGGWLSFIGPMVYFVPFLLCPLKAADYIPQQFGGFRPECYVATWKDKAGRLIVPDERYRKQAPAGLDSENGVLVKVRYRSEKHLYLAPVCETKREAGDPAGGKVQELPRCLMVSTDGLQSLQPITCNEIPCDEQSGAGQKPAAGEPKP
ncbi:hypothetical protein [Verrucomicrobium sp. 3C]|uniref:hypothetical protein n=1 Tax=Verrucomicrobium sp. 3C TaxID=1134055 RepID=UPI0012DE0466|nr:hypothetical protein [Verrucomicrobium sp. 3C]